MRRWGAGALAIAVLAVCLTGTTPASAAPDCSVRQTYSVTGTVTLSSSSSVNDPVDQSHGSTSASGSMTGTWPIYDQSQTASFSGSSATFSELVLESTQVRDAQTSTSQGSSTFSQDDNIATAVVRSSGCTVSAEISFGAQAHSIYTVYDPYGGITRQDEWDAVQPVGTIHLSYVPVIDGVAAGSSTGPLSVRGSYSDMEAGLYATSGTVGQRSETESGTPTSSITVTWSFSVKFVDEMPSVTIEGLHIEDQSIETPGTWETTPSTYEGNDTRVKFIVRNEKDPATGGIVVDDMVSGRTLKTYSAQTFPTGETAYAFSWDTDGWAWEANQTPMSGRTLRVTILVDGGLTATSAAYVVVKPRPVVLVHGLWSDASTWVDFKPRLSAVNPEWQGYAVGDGIFPGTMHTGDMTDPSVASYTVGQNAREEWKYITDLRKTLNARQVDVVAHSMGGIITRYVINELMPATGVPVIRTLKMLGTPNGGSTCADTIEVPATYPLRPASMQLFNAFFPGYKSVPTSLTYSTVVPYTCLDSTDGDIVVPEWSSLTTPTNERDKLQILHNYMTGSETMFTEHVLPWLARNPESEFPTGLVRSAASSPRAVPADPVQISASGDIADSAKPAGQIVVQPGESMTVTLVAPAGTKAKLLGANGKSIAFTQFADWPVYTATIRAASTKSIWQLSGSAVSASSHWTAAVSDSNFIMNRSVKRSPTSYTLTVPLTLNGRRLLRAQVTATATPVAGGKSTKLTLRDDGKSGDAKGSDGVYTIKVTIAKGADLNLEIRAVAPDGRVRTGTTTTVDSF